MPTCQQIITRALQKIGIVSAGGSPNSNDNQLALDALKAIYQHQITSGAHGQLIDVIPADANYTANENERIINDGTISVTLPDTISYWQCDDVYGSPTFYQDGNLIRPPRDLAVIEEVRTDTGVTNTYIYDSRTRKWMEVNGLTYSSDCPLAMRDANGLCCLLALNVAPEFSQTPDQLTVDAAFKYQSGLAHNWSQAGDVLDPPDFF